MVDEVLCLGRTGKRTEGSARRGALIRALGLAVLAVLAGVACAGKNEVIIEEGTEPGYDAGPPLNFLEPCGAETCAEGLSCLCGKCTKSCAKDADCSAIGASAFCIQASALPYAHECIGVTGGVCLERCTTDEECRSLSNDLACTDGACVPWRPQKSGGVTAQGNIDGFWAFAGFASHPSEGSAKGCPTLMTTAHCSISDCSGLAGEPQSAGERLDGGLITITGKLTLELEPAGDTPYMIGAAEPLWEPGKGVRANVAGSATVPAFELIAAGPDYVELLAPVTTTPPLTIRRTEALDVRWTPGTVGTLSVQIRQGYVYARCEWPVQAGSGRIPQRMLALLPYRGAATFYVMNTSGAEQRDGEWLRYLSLSATPANAPRYQDIIVE